MLCFQWGHSSRQHWEKHWKTRFCVQQFTTDNLPISVQTSNWHLRKRRILKEMLNLKKNIKHERNFFFVNIIFVKSSIDAKIRLFPFYFYRNFFVLKWSGQICLCWWRSSKLFKINLTLGNILIFRV